MITLFVILTAVPFAGLTWASVRQASQAVDGEVRSRLSSNATLAAAALEREMQGLAELVSSYASRPHLIEHLTAKLSESDRLEDVRMHLRELQQSRRGIAAAFLADPSGRLIQIVPATPGIVGKDFSFRDWYQGVVSTGRPYVSSAYRTSAPRQPRMVAASALVHPESAGGSPAKKALAILGAAYSVNTIQAFVDNFASSRVRLTVTDRHGVLLARPGHRVNRLVSHREDPPVAAALRGRSGVVAQQTRSGRILSAYVPISRLGWTMTASVPAADAFAPVRRVRVRVLSMAAIVGLLLLAGLWFIARVLRHLERAEQGSRLLADIVSSSDDAIVGKSLEGTILSWNRGAEQLYGYSAEEAVGRHISMLAPAERADEIPGILERVKRGQQVRHFETVRVNKDGTAMQVSLSVSPIRDINGGVIGASAIARDISYRKAAEEAVRASHERTRSIIDTANDAFVSIDENGVITDWNPRAEEMFGWSRVEAVGQTLADTVVPLQHREAHRAGIRHFIETGEGPVLHQTIEMTALNRAEEEFPVELTIWPMSTPRGWIFNSFIRDLTERKRVAAERDQFFSLSLDMMCVAGFDGYFRQLNPVWEPTLGWTLDELKATPFMEFVHPEDREATTAEASKLAQGAKAVGFENRYRCKDGSFRWLLWSAAASVKRGLIYAVARDITDRKAAETELHRAWEEAERANRAKSEFLSKMSHELRTPLNAILGFGQLLEMDNLNAEQSENVDQILKGGRHLLHLIDEVLDIARIESGRMTLSVEPVEVLGAVQEAVDLIRPLAVERGIELGLDGSDSAFALADRQRLKQVLLNLLSNAVKYNREGGTALVRIRAVPEDGVRIEVTDQGAGLSPDALGRLFTPFDRLGAEATAISGTGLGLTISKRLAEQMAGTLTVESTEGVGSTFSIQLPKARDPIQEEAGMVVEWAAQEAGHRDMTVLQIEDNPSNIKLVERILARRPNSRLLTAMQGSLGLELARQHAPDLILLDVNLPDRSGHEVLRHLRADPRVSNIPVVVMSADATKGQIERVLQAGAHAYLTKPLDVQQFLEVVDEVLESSPTQSGVTNAGK